MSPNPTPAPTPEQTQQTETHKELDKSEKEDSGRNFELFWLRGEIGGTYMNMKQFSSDTLQLENASAGGPMVGFAAGVRLVILLLGARLRYNALSSYNMWQINGELGLKFPIGSFDLLIGGHGGYSFVGSLGDASVATNQNVPSDKDQVKIRGFNAGLDFALDYYVSKNFSVGVGLFGDFLFLNRPPVDKPAGFAQLPQDQQDAVNNDPLYQKSGTSFGFAAGGALRLGLHLGL